MNIDPQRVAEMCEERPRMREFWQAVLQRLLIRPKRPDYSRR